MAEWTHAQCTDCWFHRNSEQTSDGGWTVRRPALVRSDDFQQCCFCGRWTLAGIYVRHDPSQLSCEHTEEDE